MSFLRKKIQFETALNLIKCPNNRSITEIAIDMRTYFFVMEAAKKVIFLVVRPLPLQA